MIWYLLGAAGIGFGVWLALLKVVTPKVPLISLEGAHVLVTGGSSGIGLALGIRLAKQGAHVTIIARDVKKLKEAHQQIASAAKSKVPPILDTGSLRQADNPIPFFYFYQLFFLRSSAFLLSLATSQTGTPLRKLWATPVAQMKGGSMSW